MAIVTLARARTEQIAVLRYATIVRMYDIPQAADVVGTGRAVGTCRVVCHTLEKSTHADMTASKQASKQASRSKQAEAYIPGNTASNDSRAMISRAMVSGSNRYRARSNNE